MSDQQQPKFTNRKGIYQALIRGEIVAHRPSFHKLRITDEGLESRFKDDAWKPDFDWSFTVVGDYEIVREPLRAEVEITWPSPCQINPRQLTDLYIKFEGMRTKVTIEEVI